MTTPSRNSPCWCGSGRRFKDCHGTLTPHRGPESQPAVAARPPPELEAARLADAGLAAQQAGELDQAERLYRASLALVPDQPDVLHMLGVVRMGLFDFVDARALIERAGELTQWQFPEYRHNFGYLLSAYLAGRHSVPSIYDEATRSALEALRAPARAAGRSRGRSPRIAIACRWPDRLAGAPEVPAGGRAASIASPADGPGQGAVAGLARAPLDVVLLRWPEGGEPVRALRQLLGALAPAADYVTFWSGTTRPDERRLARMVAAMDSSGAGWAFTGIAFPEDPSHELRRQWPSDLEGTLRGLSQAQLTQNLAAMCLATPALPVTIDNVVIATRLLREIDCSVTTLDAVLPELVLELCKRDEPLFVEDAPLQLSNAQARSIGQSWPQLADGRRAGLRRYVEEGLSGAEFPNPLAPCLPRNGLQFLKRTLRYGAGASLTIDHLQRIAGSLPQVARASSLRHDGFDLVGFVRAESGLGENLRAMARACEAAGIPVAASDVDLDVGIRKGDRSAEHLITAEPRFHARLILSNPDALAEALFHEGVAALEQACSIGYWAWELEKPPAAWVRAARLFDELWFPSEFVRKAFAPAVGIPTFTVPAPIRTPVPSRPYARAEFGLDEDDFVFLFSFAYGSLAARKNPWALVQAFRAAFPAGVGRVRLVLKTIQSELFPEESERLQRLAGGDPRVRFIDRYLSRDEVMGLQAACDCYVSLHRSEGFGLGMAECMALGKTVIGTGYSGNLDFMHEGNSLLVDYSLVPVQAGEYPDSAGQVWADADIESAARQMRRAHDDRALRARLGGAAATLMREHYSEAAAGALLRAHLERIRQSLGLAV